MKISVAVLAITLSSLSIAENIEVPYQFVSGTKASAEQVNDNFEVVVTESNSQNTRISALEASTASIVSDQLVCHGGSDWPNPLRSGFADCMQSSDLENPRRLTLKEVLAEGWIAINSSEYSWIFHKF
jgi:hypothetical protein